MEKKKVTKKTIKKTTGKKVTSKKKTNNKKKKGFTLIELLAVIIILGILMIIAIPSVTKYISDSRKSAYIDTAKEIVAGTRNIVNEGKLGMYDTNTTYYIPAKYVNTENSLKSPYGEFTDTSAYVGVIFDGQGYKYYWISVDDAGQGIDNVTPLDKLDTDLIKSDLKTDEIFDKVKTTGIGERTSIKVLNLNGVWEDYSANDNVGEDGGQSNSYYLYSTDYAFVDIGYIITKTTDGYNVHSTYTWNGNEYESDETATDFYTDYQSAINSRGYNFFMRIKIVNDVVSAIDMGYYQNGSVYYVYGKDPSKYQTNKTTIINSFGSANCSTENSEFETTRCYIAGNPGLYIAVTDNGNINAFDGIGGDSSWSCTIYSDYSRCVDPY